MSLDRSERLDVHIDGITYSVPRRHMKTGRSGFVLNAGAIVHGRKAWIQVLVLDLPELSPQERIRKTALNRAKKKLKKEQGRRTR